MPKIDVREAAASLARDRTTRHLLIGLGLAAGAVAASAVLARLAGPAEGDRQVHEADGRAPARMRPMLATVWPPLFLALAGSGLRIWSAPRSAARTQALTLWGVVQALNAIWMALGPRRLGGRLASATASLGATGAYVWRANRVEPGPTLH